MIKNISVILFTILCIIYLINLFFQKHILLKHTKQIFLIGSFLVLSLIVFNRGDFSTDYHSYEYMFYESSMNSIKYIVRKNEWGFYLILKLLSFFTKDYQIAIGIIGLLTLIIYYSVFKKFSSGIFITIILFLVFDNYIISFNLIRNILSVAIFLYGSRYIWENNIKQYFLFIIIASVIHRSAIILFPMFWILRINFKNKNSILISLLFFIVIILMASSKNFVLFFQSLLGYNYSLNSYGIDGGDFGPFIKTLFLFIILLINYRYIDYKNIKERVWTNGCLINLLLQGLSMNMFMIQRIGFYFSGFYLLLIPLIVSKMNNKKKLVFYSILILFSFLYALLFRNTVFYFK